MRQSAPGAQKNSNESGESASAFNSDSSDPHRSTEYSKPKRIFEQVQSQRNLADHMHRNSHSEGETTSNSMQSIHSSYDASHESADHSDEEFHPASRDGHINSVHGEPGPLISHQISEPQASSSSGNSNTRPLKLPHHFRRNSSDTTGKLPNPAFGDSDWPGLHSPNSNPFLYPAQKQKQKIQNASPNQPLNHPIYPPLSGLNQPFYPSQPIPSPRASQSNEHARRDRGDPFVRNKHTPSGSSLQRLPTAQFQLGMHTLREPDGDLDFPIQQLPLPIIRPLSRSDIHSKSNSGCDSDSEGNSSHHVHGHGNPPGRKHRQSSSSGHIGANHPLARLHEPTILSQFPSICSVMTSDKSQPGQERPVQYDDSAGRMSTDMWKDEGTVCMVVKLRGIAVIRRCDNNMINGTKLLNSARISRGRRDGMLKAERIRHVIRVGGMDYKGVWVPFERAMDMAKQENVLDMLYPLFLADLRQIFRIPENYSRLMQVIRGSRINAQFSLWLTTINSTETYRPGYHFYPRLPNPYSQNQVISANPFDDDIAALIEDPEKLSEALRNSSGFNLQRRQGQQQHHHQHQQQQHQQQQQHEQQQPLPQLLRSEQNKPLNLQIDNEFRGVKKEIKPELDSIEIPSILNQQSSHFPEATRTTGLSNFGLRKFNAEEFMKPPMELYTACLKLAYQSFDPRQRDPSFYTSDDDDDDMDYD